MRRGVWGWRPAPPGSGGNRGSMSLRGPRGLWEAVLLPGPGHLHQPVGRSSADTWPPHNVGQGLPVLSPEKKRLPGPPASPTVSGPALACCRPVWTGAVFGDLPNRDPGAGGAELRLSLTGPTAVPG